MQVLVDFTRLIVLDASISRRVEPENLKIDRNLPEQSNHIDSSIRDKDWLMKAIAKRAEKKSKRLKEAQELMEATFSMVVGMPRHERHQPLLAVRCLMDCDGNTINLCIPPRYLRAQNIYVFTFNR